MLAYRFRSLFCALLLFTGLILPADALVSLATLSAQIEVYAEGGLLWPADEIGEVSNQEFGGASGWTFGGSVHFGRKQWSPFIGLQAQKMNYDFPDGANRLDLLHFGIPIGLAYHLRPRSTSFNLMSSLAWSPFFAIDDPVSDITAARGLPSNFQLGLTLTLDYLYLGGRWLFFPDGRFGTQNSWRTTSGLVIGARW